jgi:hypothetical protein
VIKKYGDWYAEPTEFILRKTHKFGEPFSAVCVVKIIDRKAHVVGLLSNDKITKSDYASFKQLIKDLGCEPFKRQ